MTQILFNKYISFLSASVLYMTQMTSNRVKKKKSTARDEVKRRCTVNSVASSKFVVSKRKRSYNLSF